MIKNILFKAIGVCVLSVVLYIPVGSAAPITQFTFNTIIQEYEDKAGSSPLTAGSAVTGYIQLDDNDIAGQGEVYDDVTGEEIGYQISFDGFTNFTTFGYAQETSLTPVWQLGSFYVSVYMENDHKVTSGDLGGLPDYVGNNPGWFPNLPSVDDLVDVVELTVEYSENGGELDSEFSLFFVFDDDDEVLSETYDVDFSKFFTNSIYGEFSAGTEEEGEMGTTELWEAWGPLYGATPVPIPAAAWLFGSGLFGLIGLSRKRLF